MVVRKPLEISAAIFGILSYIILEKAEDYESFRINHSVSSSLRQKKSLSRGFRTNKTLRYFGLKPSALDRRNRNKKNEQKETKSFNGSLERSVC